MSKLGIKRPIPKPQGIPNAVPFKSEMLDEAEEFDRMRAEAAKEAAALKRAEKQLRSGTNQSVAEIVKGKLIQSQEEDHSKLTPEEIKEAERLMVLTGELDAPTAIGMSRRAHYKEMKKMLEVADVVLQVLDARDPESCRSEDIEEIVNKAGKKLIQVINKIDLVPYANARAWQRYLSSEYPALMFDASTNSQYTNKSVQNKQEAKPDTSAQDQMISELLRVLKKTWSKLKSEEKPQLIVGVVGLPNVGKSSVINALKQTRATEVSQTPGTTRQL